MRVVAFTLALASSVSLALVRAYSVEPVKQEWSGWTGFQDTVAEVVTCCWDSLEYVQLFAGAKGAGGGYAVSVYDGINLLMSSDGANVPAYGWVTFEDWDDSTYEFTKGKQYEFRFTRSGSDSINYYYPQGMRDEGGGMNQTRGSRPADLPAIAA